MWPEILLWLLLSFQYQLGVRPRGVGQLLSILQSHHLHIAGTEHLPTLRGHSSQKVSVLRRPWDSSLLPQFYNWERVLRGMETSVNENTSHPWSHHCSPMSCLLTCEFPASLLLPCPLPVNLLVPSTPLSLGSSCAPVQRLLPAPSQASHLLASPPPEAASRDTHLHSAPPECFPNWCPAGQRLSRCDVLRGL